MTFSALHLHCLKYQVLFTAVEGGVSYWAFSFFIVVVESLCLVKELDAVWTTSLATEPENRHPVIKEMVEVIQKED